MTRRVEWVAVEKTSQTGPSGALPISLVALVIDCVDRSSISVLFFYSGGGTDDDSSISRLLFLLLDLSYSFDLFCRLGDIDARGSEPTLPTPYKFFFPQSVPPYKEGKGVEKKTNSPIVHVPYHEH